MSCVGYNSWYYILMSVDSVQSESYYRLYKMISETKFEIGNMLIGIYREVSFDNNHTIHLKHKQLD